MSFAFYDDRLPTNKKVAWLRSNGVNGIAALGMHVLANTWSRHEGQQGFIPAYMPEQLAGAPSKKLVALLVDCGMFEQCEGGWMIHDYDDYGTDDGTPATEKSARLSRIRSEAGRRGGKASVASKQASKAKPNGQAKAEQTSTPTPLPTNSPTSPGSRNAPVGFAARIVRSYVEAATAASLPAPEESQSRVERSARSLLEQGYDSNAIEQAAVVAGREGWTDLATQMQRNAANSRTSAQGGKESTADVRFAAGNNLAQELERKAIGS